MLIQIIAGVIFAYGIILILSDSFKLSYRKTEGLTEHLIKGNANSFTGINNRLEKFAKAFEKTIKLNAYKKAVILSDLQTAGLEITPERHIANCVVKSLIIAFLALPCYYLSPLLSVGVLVVAFLRYRSSVQLTEQIKKKREEIETELPRFVFAIEGTLRHSRDLLGMIENYYENAGEYLKRELKITAADIRSGNEIEAIKRLESRVGSAMMSDVCRGLISIVEGGDTLFYWQSLSLKFSDIQRQYLLRKANKAPNRVNRLSMALFICFMALYIVVVLLSIADSFNVLFK